MDNNRHSTDELFFRTITYFAGSTQQIQHFTKVHAYAALIGRAESLSETEQLMLEAAAVVHDVGIPPAERKYGSCAGKYQELEGPPVSRGLMEPLGFSADVIDRVCYLVGHHHTYSNIDGKDYQILVESDFLVNLFEGGEGKNRDAVVAVRDNIFRTCTGIRLLGEMFGL